MVDVSGLFYDDTETTMVKTATQWLIAIRQLNLRLCHVTAGVTVPSGESLRDSGSQLE